MNLNKHKNKMNKLAYDGKEIIKKSILYVRELDFTTLSYYKSHKYGIEKTIYKYVGVSDETIETRTSKWTRKNIDKNNKIGRLLRSIMTMERMNSIKELNKYLVKNTFIQRQYYTREQSEEVEKTLISINLWEQANLKTVCLNTKDAEVKVINGKYMVNY